MIRSILPSLAIVAMLSLAAQPVPAQASESISLNFSKIERAKKKAGQARTPRSLSGRRPQASKRKAKPFTADSFQFGVER